MNSAARKGCSQNSVNLAAFAHSPVLGPTQASE